MKKLTWLYILVMVFVLVSCGQSQEVKQEPYKEMVYGQDYNGQTISVKVDDQIKVNLRGNQTTPYHWKGPQADKKIFDVVLDEYVPDEAPEGMVGTPGTFKYELKFTSEGITKLVWKEAHVGDENDVSQTFEMTVTVSK